jgi:hypothetical protein
MSGFREELVQSFRAAVEKAYPHLIMSNGGWGYFGIFRTGTHILADLIVNDDRVIWYRYTEEGRLETDLELADPDIWKTVVRLAGEL